MIETKDRLSKLDKIVFDRKVIEGRTNIYGSISSVDVMQYLKEKDILINRNSIVLNEGVLIKRLGVFDLKCEIGSLGKVELKCVVQESS